MTSVSLLSAQRHYLLEQFTAVKDRQRVLLTWTMKAGASCYGIGILRSAGDDGLRTIGTIPGICGSENETMSFSFIDENPVPNTVNKYVLELGFSGQTYPPLELNFIDLSNHSSRVVPNPLMNEGNVYFENTGRTVHTLQIFTSAGIKISEIKSQDDFFTISFSESDHLKGIFYYLIEDENLQIKASGSFIKP
jgi:hypothetical protein